MVQVATVSMCRFLCACASDDLFLIVAICFVHTHTHPSGMSKKKKNSFPFCWSHNTHHFPITWQFTPIQSSHHLNVCSPFAIFSSHPLTVNWLLKISFLVCAWLVNHRCVHILICVVHTLIWEDTKERKENGRCSTSLTNVNPSLCLMSYIKPKLCFDHWNYTLFSDDFSAKINAM